MVCPGRLHSSRMVVQEACNPTSSTRLWDQTTLLRVLFSLVLKTSKDGDYKTDIFDLNCCGGFTVLGSTVAKHHNLYLTFVHNCLTIVHVSYNDT